MDDAPNIVVSLGHDIVAALIATISGFFGSEQRFSLLFLATAAIATYFVFRYQTRNRAYDSARDELKGLIDFLAIKSVFLHPSAKLDYGYWLIRGVLLRIVVTPLYLLLFVPATDAGQQFAFFLADVFGPIAPSGDTSLPLWLGLLYGFCLLAAADLGHYWVHRLFHTIPALWEFHKVHHSAEVLVPATALRIHPVETLCEKIMGLIVIGITSGVFFYFFGDRVHFTFILGANYAYFLSNFAAANLRHSHIWLSFGKRVEHIFMSPAQHQVHHSTDPAHYNKNMATHLSLWDWMFGTLYLTSPEKMDLEFGIGEEENKHFRSFFGLLIYPFISSARTLRSKTNRHQEA